jgi:hypothetical protein
MANRKQEREAAAAESVREVNERNAQPAPKKTSAAPKASARPGGTTRRQVAKLAKVRDAIQDVPISDAEKALAPTRNLPSLLPTPAKPHKRAAKDQAKVQAETDAAVGEIRDRQAAFQDAADTSRDVELLHRAAVNLHQKHVREVNALKKRFPKEAAIQALVPKTLLQFKAELAAKPRAEALAQVQKPVTPTRQRNRGANERLGALRDAGHVDDDGLLKPAVAFNPTESKGSNG